MDQDKGWTLLNRGKVIGNISFNVRDLLIGLSSASEKLGKLVVAARIKYYDIVLDHGRGAMVTDIEGNDYIDLLASASSTNTGHAHPRVVKAIQELPGLSTTILY